jgi:hypothetical protein
MDSTRETSVLNGAGRYCAMDLDRNISVHSPRRPGGRVVGLTMLRRSKRLDSALYGMSPTEFPTLAKLERAHFYYKAHGSVDALAETG